MGVAAEGDEEDRNHVFLALDRAGIADHVVALAEVGEKHFEGAGGGAVEVEVDVLVVGAGVAGVLDGLVLHEDEVAAVLDVFDLAVGAHDLVQLAHGYVALVESPDEQFADQDGLLDAAGGLCGLC